MGRNENACRLHRRAGEEGEMTNLQFISLWLLLLGNYGNNARIDGQLIVLSYVLGLASVILSIAEKLLQLKEGEHGK